MKNRLADISSSAEMWRRISSDDSQEGVSERDRTEAFLALHAHNHHRLAAFVHTIVPNWQDAEELIQDTLVILWRKFDEFDRQTSFFSWAARVAQYEVLNYRRRASHRCHAIDECVLEALSATALERIDDIDQCREALEKCLAQLSDRDRDLVRLRYEEEGDVPSIAAGMGRDAGHVHRLIRGVRARLLRCIRSRLN